MEARRRARGNFSAPAVILDRPMISTDVASWLVRLTAVYLGVGALFAGPFAFRLVNRWTPSRPMAPGHSGCCCSRTGCSGRSCCPAGSAECMHHRWSRPRTASPADDPSRCGPPSLAGTWSPSLTALMSAFAAHRRAGPKGLPSRPGRAGHSRAPSRRASTMSAFYRAVNWNRQKFIYDGLLAADTSCYLATSSAVTLSRDPKPRSRPP